MTYRYNPTFQEHIISDLYYGQEITVESYPGGKDPFVSISITYPKEYEDKNCEVTVGETELIELMYALKKAYERIEDYGKD